jgi:hypothetical protein
MHPLTPYLVGFAVVYGSFVYHLKKGWLDNGKYISPIYNKPSYARYSEKACGDKRSIIDEWIEITESERTANDYYIQGRGVTRDMIRTGVVNYESGGEGESNPIMNARTSNRGIFQNEE